MVFKKRLDHGFNGFQVPAIPRAPRSVRRRGLCKKTVEDSQICAFELLASIAGKLLQESESSASSNASEGNDQPSTSKDVVKREQQDEDKPFMAGWTNQGSCGDSSLASELASQNINLKCILKAHARESPPLVTTPKPQHVKQRHKQNHRLNQQATKIHQHRRPTRITVSPPYKSEAPSRQLKTHSPTLIHLVIGNLRRVALKLHHFS